LDLCETLGRDERDRHPSSVDPTDFDQWLKGTVEDAAQLIRLTPAEIFDAGMLDAGGGRVSGPAARRASDKV
jgi:hypothetical protein